MGINHRVTQFFHEKLVESMPLKDEKMQRCIQMDLSSQQGNRELVNNIKMGVSRPRQLEKFAYFRVRRVKLSCGEA